MSRISITLLVISLANIANPANAQVVSAETALETYEQLTVTRPNCRQVRSTSEIQVCGRREADRFRLPLIIQAKGDPRSETPAAERLRLQHITTPCQDNSIFLVGCGFAGVSVTTGFDGSRPKARPLAD